MKVKRERERETIKGKKRNNGIQNKKKILKSQMYYMGAFFFVERGIIPLETIKLTKFK